MTQGATVVLYDGICALCNGVVRFILSRDRRAIFRFAPLQGDLARGILARHGQRAEDLQTFVVVIDLELPTERVLRKSAAATFVLGQLGGISRAAGVTIQLIPRVVRDAVYDFVARRRYRTFGTLQACPLPDARHRSRFLEL